MKKTLFTLLATFMVATGAQAADLKVAVVDEMSVFDKTEASKKFLEVLKGDFEKNDAKLREMEKEFIQRKEDLQRKKGVLSDEKFLDEETELRKMASRFRNEQRRLAEDLEKKKAEKRKAIYEAIGSVVEELAKKNGYQVVMPKGSLIYNVESIDISAKVLEKVNKKLSSK